MSFIDLLNASEIDLSAVKRIRHRVFVVGRFNQRSRGTYPDRYLFTNRPADSLSDEYREGFTDVASMRYESFVKMLRPAISEKADTRGRINFVTQVIPQDDKANEGTSIIDTFNFFFMRAIANSPQEYFSGSKPGLPDKLLRESKGARGKQIFQLIRKNVADFSGFQPRTHEIIQSISRLFSACGRRNIRGIIFPDYAEGDALPAGFPERLIDFLYAEDGATRFSAEGLEFTGAWKELQTDENARELFCSVVSAFRDAILGSTNPKHGQIHFENTTLDVHASGAIPADLKTAFQGSREAFNGLRQMLRSKVLLSMVLEWLLLEGLERVDDALAFPDKDEEHDRDRAIENAILENWKKNKLAKPVERASQEERDKFSKSLTANFEKVIAAVLAADSQVQARMDEVPSELRKLAEDLRKDEGRREVLLGVSGKEFGNEYQKAFVDAAKVILLDVLCPALYQLPILTPGQLRQYFRQETMSAYLTAVFLATDSQDAVRKIADEHLEFFQQRIDKATQRITKPEEIQKKLLESFIDVIAKPEIRKRLQDGLRVLNEGHTILQNATIESVATMVPIRPDPKIKKNRTLENTEIRTEMITGPLGKVLETKVAERVMAVQKNEAAAGLHAGVTPAAEGAPASRGAFTAEAAAEIPVQESDFEKNAGSAIDEILRSAYPDTPVSELDDEDVSDLVSKATAELTSKPGFMQGVKNDVRAFEESLFLIYQRYNDNRDKKTFRNRVERLTLINMMLLYQKELGLGEVSSNLHHLLLDMIQHLDPQNPDLKTFLKEKSLTTYFDNAFIKDRGITNLRQTLRAQADDSLTATVSFVSELRGVKYLMDVLEKDPLAEVVIVNATAEEFRNWLLADNLNDVDGRGGIRCGAILKTDHQSERTIVPGLVYLSDLAFTDPGDKVAFLGNLGQFNAQNDRHGLVLPPLCISTRPFSSGPDLEKEGAAYAEAAFGAAAPVVVLGPSPRLTQDKDPFRAYLPAGYLFAAHFLAKPNQKIAIRSVNVSSNGRFRVIGAGNVEMRESLEGSICGESAADKYAFAVDFYLYIVLTIIAAASSRAGAGARRVDPDTIYKHFHEDFGGALHKESSALNEALLLPATSFSMYASPDSEGKEPAKSDPKTSAVKNPVTQATNLTGVIFKQKTREGKTLQLDITDVHWFNLARDAAGFANDMVKRQQA